MGEKVYIGLDIGGTNLKVSLVNRAGEILAAATRPSPRGGADDLQKGFVEAVRPLAEGVNLGGIGIGCAGVVSTDRRRVLAAPNLPEIEGFPLGEILEREFGVETLLENDANAVALGELWRGAGAGARTFILLTLGTGLGTGFILEGRVWRGTHGMGAEGGHMTIDIHGPPCRCGNRGCLEAFVGASAIQKRLAERLTGRRSALKTGANPTVEEISEAARRGDALAQEVLAETGRYLGAGLANFANIFDPERIVITGGVSRAGKIILAPAEEEMRRRAFRAITQRVEVVPGRLGDDAGPLGAVYSLLEGRG